MNSNKWVLFLGAFGVVWGGLAMAQDSLQQPTLEPGAVFHYQTFDQLKNSVTRTEVHTVVSVSKDRARLDVSRDGNPASIVTLDTAHQFLLGKANTGAFEYIRFPLKVGDSWSYSFTTPDSNPGVQLTRDLSAKFVGWEQVTVPAGTYKAAKIVHSGTWSRSDGPYRGGLELVFWYAPEVGRWVKQSYTWYGSQAGINQKFDILLTKYQPASDMPAPFALANPVTSN